jgi:hypothetical protein
MTPDPTPAPRASEMALAAETEASRALAADAVPDNPNPPAAEVAAADAPVVEAPAAEAPKPREHGTAFDRGRADIAARFKAKRAAQGGQVDFHGDMRDPSQTYAEFVAPSQMTDDGVQRTEEMPAAQPQQAAAAAAPALPPAPAAPPTSDIRPPTSEPAPRLVKVKVHGREAWLPEAEVIAEAQKSLAAGNLLESAKEVLATARQPVAETPADAADDQFAQLAQTLQLEPDAKVAGAKLRETLNRETAAIRQEAVTTATRQMRIENELVASQRALTAFETNHPELAADEFARDAITSHVQREINADLQAAVNQGILRELPRNQDERNALHTQLRAFGAPVARPIDRGNEISGVAGRHTSASAHARPRARVCVTIAGAIHSQCRTACRALARPRATAGEPPHPTDQRHRAAARRPRARAHHGSAAQRGRDGDAQSPRSNRRVSQMSEIRCQRSEVRKNPTSDI